MGTDTSDKPKTWFEINPKNGQKGLFRIYFKPGFGFVARISSHGLSLVRLGAHRDCLLFCIQKPLSKIQNSGEHYQFVNVMTIHIQARNGLFFVHTRTDKDLFWGKKICQKESYV